MPCLSVSVQDPDTLDSGIEGPLGRARASSDGCLFESSRLDEPEASILPGQEAQHMALLISFAGYGFCMFLWFSLAL